MIWSSALYFVDSFSSVDLYVFTGRHSLLLTFAVFHVNELERSIFTSRFKTFLFLCLLLFYVEHLS